MCEGEKEEGGSLVNHEQERQCTVNVRDVGISLGTSFSPDTANAGVNVRRHRCLERKINLLEYWLPT